MHVKLQDSLIVSCKRKSKETHSLQMEKVKTQIAKRLRKKSELKDKQTAATLSEFKDASWLHQQHKSPRFWGTPKKAFDEFQKLGSESKKKKCVKEQILIVCRGLGITEAHHPWSKGGHEYTSVELLEHFIEVALPLSKTRKLPTEAPMEHPRLPELPVLGTLSSDVAEYYTTQAKNDNELRMNALRQREKEELMGIWDGAEYMNEVNWPEKKLKNGYKIEMCFSYPYEDEENRFMWCCGVVERVKKRDDKVIKADIRWSEEFVACGESDLTEEMSKKLVESREAEERSVEAGCTGVLEEI